jgi:predicted transcriptional regulator
MPYVPAMGKQQAISVSLDSDWMASLDELAVRLGCSREQLIRTAVVRLLDEEAPMDELWKSLPEPPPQEGLEVLDDAAKALRDVIQEGIDSAERGELVDHGDVIADLRRRRRKSAA